MLLLHAFRFVGLAFLVPGVVSPDLPDAFAHPGRAGPAAGAPATGRFLQAGRGRMVSSLWMGSPPSAGASVEVDTPRMAMLHLPLGSLGIAASG